MKEKVLKQRIENCISHLQDKVDIEAAKAILNFESETTNNYELLDKLQRTYIENHQEIERFKQLKIEYTNQLSELEKKITYWEDLASELEEFNSELQIKLKKYQHKQKNR